MQNGILCIFLVRDNPKCCVVDSIKKYKIYGRCEGASGSITWRMRARATSRTNLAYAELSAARDPSPQNWAHTDWAITA